MSECYKNDNGTPAMLVGGMICGVAGSMGYALLKESSAILRVLGGLMLGESAYALLSIAGGTIIFLISLTSFISISDFNKATVDQAAAYLEQDWTLFARAESNAANRELFLYKMDAVFQKYPYMKEYRDNTLTVLKISNKYPLLPVEDIAAEVAKLPEADQKKGSAVMAVTAKKLTEFDKEAVTAAIQKKFDDAATDIHGKIINDNIGKMIKGFNRQIAQ